MAMKYSIPELNAVLSITLLNPAATFIRASLVEDGVEVAIVNYNYSKPQKWISDGVARPMPFVGFTEKGKESFSKRYNFDERIHKYIKNTLIEAGIDDKNQLEKIDEKPAVQLPMEQKTTSEKLKAAVAAKKQSPAVQQTKPPKEDEVKVYGKDEETPILPEDWDDAW